MDENQNENENDSEYDSESRTAFGKRVARDAIRYRRALLAPPARVWRALVTPSEVAQWLGTPVTIEARVGGTFEVRFNDEDRMTGRIVEFEPERRLVLIWHEESRGVPSGHATRADDRSEVTFELAPGAENGTELTFTHRFIRAGDRMIGFGAGWHAHLDALAALAEREPLPDRALAYERLRPAYERIFG
jgi:uncharacterized protein YndB with AHSA1/START domain